MLASFTGTTGTPLHLYSIVTTIFVTVIYVKTITARVPKEDYEALERIEEEENKKRADLVRELLKQGLKEMKKKKALKLLKNHEVTLREAAEIADTTYVEILNLASEEDLDIGYSKEELKKDLERIK